jgi:hypothetical protein
MTHDERETIRVFLARLRTDWYDLGFSDPVEWSAVHRPIDEEEEDEPDLELCRRLSYLTGAADMARLGNAFMSTQYLIANTIGNLCRTLMVGSNVQRTLDVYERELAALLAALAATVRAA